SWQSRNDRSTGALTTTTGPGGEPALDLVHDFTTSTGTRGMYALFPEAVPGGRSGRLIEGQPQALTLWIDGNGNGEWPRLQVVTGAGTTVNLDGPNVTWTGWQQARFTVPPGTPYPLTIQRIRFMETRAAASYQGHLRVAALEAIVPPSVEQPVEQRIHDPFIITDGTVDDRPQRIAVMSDSQFVGRAPDSDIVAAARRTLREIVAADPDLLVINGDFVDEAAPLDIALAKRILDEEVGDSIPYVYVPGNHEVMGGSIDNFRAVFGDTRKVVRVGGTMLITLNTANGSYRGTEADQLAWFDDQLDAAARDGGVSGVIVFSHHPADDPLPNKASQLGDRVEAAAFVDRLAEFRADTGKSIAVINAHVGMFHATSTDGVSRFVNGNSGKGPSSTPADGGFTGWTMLGVDPGAGRVGTDPATVDARIGWLRAETRPRVDALALSAPAVLEVGETAPAFASITQDGTRTVPVAWPISADWSGDGVVIDDGTGAERAAGVVRLNPVTGQLTATGAGIATLRVTVNGVAQAVEVRVVGAPAGQPGGGTGGDADAGGADADASRGDLASTGGGGAPIAAITLGLLALLGGIAAVVIGRRSRRT
ncbi:MAG TPA: metallophosphoesterase, partial [Rhodoglobus sp.]|nr:metallophosphoesterase [Rhodoglobus sp.]